MSQIATTIEQSKRLLDAGIDPKSADMRWETFPGCVPHLCYQPDAMPLIAPKVTRAWSLSKLWDICNDSGIGPFNFGGDDIGSSGLVAKLVDWIILGVHDYEVIGEYLNEETRQEQSNANH